MIKRVFKTETQIIKARVWRPRFNLSTLIWLTNQDTWDYAQKIINNYAISLARLKGSGFYNLIISKTGVENFAPNKAKKLLKVYGVEKYVVYNLIYLIEQMHLNPWIACEAGGDCVGLALLDRYIKNNGFLCQLEGFHEPINT